MRKLVYTYEKNDTWKNNFAYTSPTKNLVKQVEQ